MADFQFRLKSVQTLRKRNRDLAAEALRQAHEAKQILCDQREQLGEEIAEQSALQAAFQGQAISGLVQAQKVLESQRYQLHLHSQVKLLQEKIELVEQECQRRKQTLIERETEVKALERLRENQLTQWQHLQIVRAQNRLDEWAGYRHWSNTQSSSEEIGEP